MTSRRERQEWLFFTSLHKADRPLAVAWWSLLALRGVLPAAMAVTMGVLIGAVERGDDLAGDLAPVRFGLGADALDDEGEPVLEQEAGFTGRAA